MPADLFTFGSLLTPWSIISKLKIITLYSYQPCLQLKKWLLNRHHNHFSLNFLSKRYTSHAMESQNELFIFDCMTLALINRVCFYLPYLEQSVHFSIETSGFQSLFQELKVSNRWNQFGISFAGLKGLSCPKILSIQLKRCYEGK